MNRDKLIAELLTMPEEAFSWLVLACVPFNPQSPNPGAKIWPDGLGGFMPDSRASILRAQGLAKQILEAP